MTRIREEEDWPLVGGLLLLHVVQRGGDWRGGSQPRPLLASCTKCYTHPSTGMYRSTRIEV